MSRALLPAPEVPRPERFRLRTEISQASNPVVGLVIAEDAMGPAGTCRVLRDGTEVEVRSVDVSERAIGSGLDASLVATGLQWAEIEGAETAVVYLEPEADTARVFRRLGFMAESTLR